MELLTYILEKGLVLIPALNILGALIKNIEKIKKY